MMKKNKALPAKEARIASERGRTKRTNAVINSCIGTLNKYIDAATMDGEYAAHTWFRNNSGVLTLDVMNIIADHFRKVGYLVEVKQTEEDSSFVEEYFIELNWEDAAC